MSAAAPELEARLTDLPLSRAVARLAIPAMASVLMANLFNLVDAFWVGRLGTAALGGMTASAFFVWCLHSAGQLVGTGVNALVARRTGAGLPHEAGLAAGNGLVLAVLLALGASAVVLPAQDALVGALGLAPDVRQAASQFLVPILWGFPTITCWYSIEATFRGSGDTRTPMVILGLTLLLNALLDPLFIFGAGPLPALGIGGAAAATVLSHGVGVIAGLLVLRGRAVRPRLAGAADAVLLGAIARVGAPIAASGLLFSVMYLFLARIIADFGSAPVAAVGVGHRIEGLAYFTCVGFAAAAATLVGQHLGAAQPARAERAAWLAALMSCGLVGAIGLLYFFAARPIVAVFSDDPAVISHGTEYLRVIAFFEIGMALELVLEGAFGGAGDSMPPMLVSVPLTALRVPAAWFLAHELGWGAAGVWWSVALSSGLKGVVMAAWFRLGRWKHARL